MFLAQCHSSQDMSNWVKKTGTSIKKLEQLTMTPQIEYINNIKQMRGNYDEGCTLFVIKVSYHMHFQWVSKSMWKDVVQPFNCQSLLQSKVTLLYVCTFKLNYVHNSKFKHINIKSQSHLKCYSVASYFRIQKEEKEEEEEGEGLLLAVVKFTYVLTEYQKQHNALYVLKGNGFQCFQPCRKWSKLR